MKNGLDINEFGTKRWYKDDLLHRDDGPAIEWDNGTKFWFKNNQLHREDGPAVECVSGDKSWYLNGKKIYCQSQEEFEKLIKLKAFW
jgi:hypothetical protein